MSKRENRILLPLSNRFCRKFRRRYSSLLFPYSLSFPEEFPLHFQFQSGRDSITFSRDIVAESGVQVSEFSPEKVLLTGDARFSVSLSQ